MQTHPPACASLGTRANQRARLAQRPATAARSEELGGEVVEVEVVQAHVAVLTARREAAAAGAEGHGVDGAEVAAHVTKLLLVDLVEEARLEAAGLGGRRRNLQSAAHVHVRN